MLFKNRRHDFLSASEISEIRQLKCDFSAVREQIDDHLESINENTGEIELQNNFICEIDNRLTKMEERMDELHFLLKNLVTQAKLSVELSKDEQRAFLILYTHDKFMSTQTLSKKAYLSEDSTGELMMSLMDKGIPLEREILDGNMYFRMNNEFKLRQAKEQIIKIDSDVTGQFQNALLRQFFNA